MTTEATQSNEKSLEALRAPFPPEVVGLLPKGPKVADNQRVACAECGGFLGPHVHLNYIGWAAVVDRMLETDEDWNWEPYAVDEYGLPAFRESPNNLEIELWIKLTVLGKTRIGVGVVGKSETDLAKKLISDSLKNAANKFGIALYLWSKDELESLIGNETVETVRRRPPRGGSATGGSRSRGGSNPIQGRDEGTAGTTGVSAKDRNRIISHLARGVTPPIIGDDAVAAHISALLNKKVEHITKLEEADGQIVLRELGLAE